jgi:aminocarboxymuconate-semialdehyde decarboxylase
MTANTSQESSMTTRRNFIGHASAFAGAVFCGCGLLDAPHVHAQPAARRREVVVSGRRVTTVDIHAHCVFPEVMAMLDRKWRPPNLVVGADRFKAMDEQGIDMEAISINPFWYDLDRDKAEALIKFQNEKLAELVAAHPDHFVAFATVAMQHPDLAVQQLEHGVKTLGLRGMSVGGSVEGMELANPKFHPIWAKCEELGILVFMHPVGTKELRSRLQGNGGLENTIGNPLETTLALSHLIYEGTLDRFPGLKICAAHGGGYLPFYAPRSDAVCVTFPDRCAHVKLKKKPTEYLKDFYYDSIIFTPEMLQTLAREVGTGHVMMGTDYPFPWTHTSVDHILDTPGFSDAEKAAMLGDNAVKLLGIKT